METKKFSKRYCLVLPYSDYIEKFLLRLKMIKKESNLDVINIEYYRHGILYFGLIDIQSQFDININNVLKKLASDSGFEIPETILLERIFKKNLKNNNYTSRKENNYKRFVMTLELEDDIEILEAYKTIHRQDKVWPQVIENMNTMGIIDMELYLYSNSAFLIMDTPCDYDIEREGEQWSQLPKEKEWQQHVAKFQKVDPKSKAMEKWIEMKLINSIGY